MRAAIAIIALLGLLANPGWAGPTAVTQAGQVQVELSIARARYRSGDPVEIVLTVSNPTTAEVTFQFNTGQMYDFVVQRDGRVIWRWSEGRAFIQALTTLVIRPGESRVFRARWDQKNVYGQQVPAGKYEMVAVFPVRRGPDALRGLDEPRVQFSIRESLSESPLRLCRSWDQGSSRAKRGP